MATTNVLSERTFASLTASREKNPTLLYLLSREWCCLQQTKPLRGCRPKPASAESIFWTALSMALKNTDSYTGNGVYKLVNSSNSKFNKRTGTADKRNSHHPNEAAAISRDWQNRTVDNSRRSVAAAIQYFIYIWQARSSEKPTEIPEIRPPAACGKKPVPVVISGQDIPLAKTLTESPDSHC